jgi:hypothetical protein
MMNIILNLNIYQELHVRDQHTYLYYLYKIKKNQFLLDLFPFKIEKINIKLII